MRCRISRIINGKLVKIVILELIATNNGLDLGLEKRKTKSSQMRMKRTQRATTHMVSINSSIKWQLETPAMCLDNRSLTYHSICKEATQKTTQALQAMRSSTHRQFSPVLRTTGRAVSVPVLPNGAIVSTLRWRRRKRTWNVKSSYPSSSSIDWPIFFIIE